MRRFISAILLISFISCMALPAAGSVEALSAEDRMEYISKALSVETETHTDVAVNAYDFDSRWHSGFVTSYGTSTTTTEWVPYMGYQRISRADFLDIAGYPDLAEAERAMEKGNNTRTIVGWSFIGAGLAVMLSSLIPLAFDTPNDTLSSGLLLGGSLLTLVGVPICSWQVTSDISMSFAIGIADSYNQRLLESF